MQPGPDGGDVVIYEYPIFFTFLIIHQQGVIKEIHHHYGKYLNINEYPIYFASGVCISCNCCRIYSSQFCTSLNGTPDLSQPPKWQVLKSIETVQLLPGVAAETGSGCIVDTRNYMFAFKLNPKTGPTNRVKIHQAKTSGRNWEHVDTHSVLH